MKGKLETALDFYKKKFGKNYPLLVVDRRNEDEIIRDIAECIKKNKAAEPPKYEPGCVY